MLHINTPSGPTREDYLRCYRLAGLDPDQPLFTYTAFGLHPGDLVIPAAVARRRIAAAVGITPDSDYARSVARDVGLGLYQVVPHPPASLTRHVSDDVIWWSAANAYVVSSLSPLRRELP